MITQLLDQAKQDLLAMAGNLVAIGIGRYPDRAEMCRVLASWAEDEHVPRHAGALMFEPEPPSKLTPRLRARILREELEYRLEQLESLHGSIRDTAGADNRERMRADTVAVAIEYVRRAMDALALASQE